MDSSRRQFLQTTAMTLGGLVSLRTDAAPIRTGQPAMPDKVGPPPLPKGAFQRLGTSRFLTSMQRITSLDGISFSSDDRFIFGNFSNAICVWDLETGFLHRTLSNAVQQSYYFSEDDSGGCIAIYEEVTDKIYKLVRYDLVQGTSATLCQFKIAGILFASVDKQGKRIFAIDDTTKTLKAFSTANGQELWKYKLRDLPNSEYKISADGRRLAILNRTTLTVFDTATGQETIRISSPRRAAAIFTVMSLSPDGRFVITIDREFTHTAWETTTAKKLWSSTAIQAPQFMPDGKSLIAIKENASVVLYDSTTGKELRKYSWNRGEFATLSGSGKYVALWSMPLVGMQIMNVKSGDRLPQSSSPGGEIDELRFHGKFVVADSNYNVEAESYKRWFIWDPGNQTCNSKEHVKMRTYEAADQKLSPDTSRFAKVVDGRLLVFDTQTSGQLYRINIPRTYGVVDDTLAWGQNGKSVLLLTTQGLAVVDMATRKTRLIPYKLQGSSTSNEFAVSVDGNVAVVMFQDDNAEARMPNVMSWSVDLKTGKVNTRSLGNCLISSIQLSHDGSRLQTTTMINPEAGRGSDDMFEVQVTELATGRTIFVQRTPGLDDAIPHFCMSPDGCSVIVHETPKRIPGSELDFFHDIPLATELREVLTGALRKRWESPCTSIISTFSPDGRRLATSHFDAPIYIWDVYGEKTNPMPEPRDLQKLWNELASLDGEVGFRAVCQCMQHPMIALKLLGQMLTPAKPANAEVFVADIAKLGHADFRTREAAEKRLRIVADSVVPMLREQLKNPAWNLEAQTRLERLLDSIHSPTSDRIRSTRCLEILGHIRTAETKAILQNLTGGAKESMLAREAMRLLNNWG